MQTKPEQIALSTHVYRLYTDKPSYKQIDQIMNDCGKLRSRLATYCRQLADQDLPAADLPAALQDHVDQMQLSEDPDVQPLDPALVEKLRRNTALEFQRRMNQGKEPTTEAPPNDKLHTLTLQGPFDQTIRLRPSESKHPRAEVHVPGFPHLWFFVDQRYNLSAPPRNIQLTRSGRKFNIAIVVERPPRAPAAGSQ